MVESANSDQEGVINEISLNSESNAVAIATSAGFLIQEFEPNKLRAKHKFEGGFLHIVLAKQSSLVLLVPTGQSSMWS
jgi:hypothetical protein